MLPLTCFQNYDGTSSDSNEPIPNNMRWTPHTLSPSTLFRLDLSSFGPSISFNRLDPPSFNSKKTDKQPIDEFLWHGICRRIGIKCFLPEWASFCDHV